MAKLDDNDNGIIKTLSLQGGLKGRKISQELANVVCIH